MGVSPLGFLLVLASAPDAGGNPGAPSVASDSVAELRWSQVRDPAAGPPEAIGQPAAGCLRGGQAISRKGKGFALVRPERHRHFGHPDLVAYVQSLGKKLRAADLGLLSVGDLSQPQGGPTPTGHRSHQNGLDVDLWYSPGKGKVPPIVVDLKTQRMTSAWGKKVRMTLRLAAEHPQVDRIFVHAAVKRALCDEIKRPAAWLGKIRPWWGHHDHFHVRLRCPEGNPGCQDGTPLAEGEGCDGSLAWWFTGDAKKPAPPKKALDPAFPKRPAACEEL